MQCALNRFRGTPAPERPINTESARQLESALDAMKREREAQNARFFPSAAATSKEQQTSKDDQQAGSR